jgi:hypothetical protein
MLAPCSVANCDNESVVKDTAASEFWVITSFYCLECYGKLLSTPAETRLDGAKVIFEARLLSQLDQDASV